MPNKSGGDTARETAEWRARLRNMPLKEAGDEIMKEGLANLRRAARKFREKHPEQAKYLDELAEREQQERNRRA